MKSVHRFLRMIGVLGLALVVLASALGVGRPPSASVSAATGPNGSRSASQDGVRVAATRPWTRQELLTAKPYDTLVVKDTGVSSRTSAAPPVILGKPGTTPAQLPADLQPSASTAPGADALVPPAASEAATEPDASIQAVAGPYAYPPPFTRLAVAGYFANGPMPRVYQAFPYRAIGKLFFTQNGVNYVCSASSIGNRAIITAGHCLHAGDNKTTGWSTNVVFVPAFVDGQAPYGQWTAADLRVMTGWYQGGNPNGLRRDVGGAILNLNTSGQKLSTVVGALGFAWNQPYLMHVFAFGYPAASPFDGSRMVVCLGSYAYTNTDGGPTSAPVTRAIGCDMTSGSSGGPWIYRFGPLNYVNGVNSYSRVGFDKEMFSPYFDQEVKGMKDCIVLENCTT